MNSSVLCLLSRYGMQSVPNAKYVSAHLYRCLEAFNPSSQQTDPATLDDAQHKSAYQELANIQTSRKLLSGKVLVNKSKVL